MKTSKCTICGKSYTPNRGGYPRFTCRRRPCKTAKLNKDSLKWSKRTIRIKNDATALKENVYSLNKDSYKDKVIDYSDSITGKAYVGFAKTPLMPNANGIGFIGVKIQSENRELLQCSSCGDWFKNITGLHLKNCCGMTVPEYKDAFGYNRHTGLTSDVFSNFLAEKAVTRNSIGPIKEMVRRTGRPIPPPNNLKRNMEMKNASGTCPEQLKDKLVNYIQRFRMIPSSHSTRENFPYATAASRYGNFNNFLKLYGLPTRNRRGGVVDYSFQDGTTYSKSARDDYEPLFALLLAKCPLLTSNFNLVV